MTVSEAEQIILNQLMDYGVESISFQASLGRVLAEDILADRDLPPFNRVTMDGIAIKYTAIEKGVDSFAVKATQAAGENPVEIDDEAQCIEIMTGAALPSSVDTVIRYEDIEIINGKAAIKTDTIKPGQNIHIRGKDKKQDQVLTPKGALITPAIISLAASVGKQNLLVQKQPRIVVISSGDELVDVHQTPSAYQIRKSNNYTVQAALKQHHLHADLLHIADDAEVTQKAIEHAINNYDVILLCGGISMGKFDYVPQALEAARVKKIFYKVDQRPGKPFWFGRHEQGVLVFAFPGNPVATFMCLHRYFLPWFYKNSGVKTERYTHAILDENFVFTPSLTYFLQVKLKVDGCGRQVALPIEGNGSGDFANLTDTDAFLELPAERNEFKKGEVYRAWPF